jgi:GNAT superfamily N-acetyltransferase
MDARYGYREVISSDANVIATQRHLMFAEAGADPADMDPHFSPWLEPRIVDGRYFGWIAMLEDEPVGGIGMMVLEWPPHPRHPAQAQRGYILNLYVTPEHRRHGIASALMERAYAEARARGITYVVLHATEQGRPLYERDGWTRTSEMAISLQ